MNDSITQLAARQLDAYNAADLDAFCACYHAEVRVFREGELSIEGIEAFRAAYADKFERGGFGATVPERISLGRHCVDLEHWWVLDPVTGARTEGALLVCYEARDGRIGQVRFLR